MDVGIIGGQDGPTAILVGGDPAAFIATALVIVAVIGALIWFFRRKRKK